MPWTVFPWRIKLQLLQLQFIQSCSVAFNQFDSSEEYCKLSCEVKKDLTECCDII